MRHVSCDIERNIDKTTSNIEDYHDSSELWNSKIGDYKDTNLKNDKLKQPASKAGIASRKLVLYFFIVDEIFPSK